MRRRTVLAGAAALGLGGGVLAGCGPAGPPAGTTRHRYGDGASQFGDLSLPEGSARGVVVVVHGGFWSARYGLEYGAPLAADLVGRGWVAWNIEYRRVGSGAGGGGGVPETLEDVAAAIALLADLELGVDLDEVPVVGLGHSAGGHLVTCAAARGGLTHVISQAGVLDLGAADRDGLGGGAVRSLLGRAPTAADAAVDPIAAVPLPVPVWCVHGGRDATVPIGQSVDYVAAARAAGGDAELVEVPGGHFDVIDTGSEAWERTVALLEGIAG